MVVFGSLRRGEIVGFQRDYFDIVQDTVSIRRAVSEVNGPFELQDPKSRAGRRVVALPRWMVDEVIDHLETYCGRGPNAGLFVLRTGSWLIRTTFNRTWRRAVTRAEIPAATHFHDLRHTGSHLAASAGASTREPMARMGHSSVRAAMIYQHQTAERDRANADAMDELS